jgi:hypothetical protein
MRPIATAALCLRQCVFGPTPRTCADRGGVLVFKFGGWMCVKKPGKIPTSEALPHWGIAP